VCRDQSETQRHRREAGLKEAWSKNRNDLDVFLAGLAQLGWRNLANVRIEQRWTEGKMERARTLAKELIELRPDVIFATTTPVTAALMRETHNIPIVFAIVSDPVGAASCKFSASGRQYHRMRRLWAQWRMADAGRFQRPVWLNVWVFANPNLDCAISSEFKVGRMLYPQSASSAVASVASARSVLASARLVRPASA
jgi:hypothetical protein